VGALNLEVGGSIGIAAGDQAVDHVELVRRADVAMDKAERERVSPSVWTAEVGARV
jgi:GGDEF domain-containing protein